MGTRIDSNPDYQRDSDRPSKLTSYSPQAGIQNSALLLGRSSRLRLQAFWIPGYAENDANPSHVDNQDSNFGDEVPMLPTPVPRAATRTCL